MENPKILSKEFIKQTLVDNQDTLQKYGVKRIGLFGSYAEEQRLPQVILISSLNSKG